MTSQEAQALQQGDVILYASQLFRVAQAFRHGQLVHLNGKTMDQIVSPRNMALVWRKDEVPPARRLGTSPPKKRRTSALWWPHGMDKETERTG